MNSSSDDLNLALRTGQASLKDAKIATVRFGLNADEPQPQPDTFRLMLKVFLYSVKEVLDVLTVLQGSPLEDIQTRARALATSDPLMAYVVQARNTLAHRPIPFIVLGGGWTRRAPVPEDTPLPHLGPGWDHVPGTITIYPVQDRKSREVPLPDGAASYSTAQIRQMMEEGVTHLEALLNDWAGRA